MMEKSTDNDNIELVEKHLPGDWQQGKSLAACMVELFDKSLWTDVKFHFKNQEQEQTIQAHRIVLAARSPVFQAMFFGPCADGKTEIELKDVEKETFLLFLRYIYSDTITLNKENASAVLEMAHYYQVSGLVKLCADFLATVITTQNCCEILTFAMFYNLTSLKTSCCSFIDSNAEQVLKSDCFLDLSAECLLYILKGDTLFAKEEVILEAAERWSRKKLLQSGKEDNGANIRKNLGESFFQLRLPTMTYKSLLEYTSRKGYFSIEEYADVAAFINKVPDVNVSTNSCVSRVPEVETLTVEIDDGSAYGGCEPKDRLSITYNFFILKDVALSNFVLSEIKPYLKYERYYTTELPESIDLILSGSVIIKCLEFEQKFSLRQQQHEKVKIDISPSLVLRKRETPYSVEINIKYEYIKIQMKTTLDRNKKRISNDTGNISVCSVGDERLSVIKSIGFLNFSNRDLGKDMDTDSNELRSDKLQSTEGDLSQEMSK
ncbi:BTB/POZ domain-containing protein 6-B-like [Mercenaria mercenaria]|uniref:BTB/POZ domain-containing protein 6-B-like n=1 Tax=Mercenaria mercenaria TaxID=6596 RepID=UPI00234F5C52|nr:BTB/POZ domain-containing protein 6-B-like [Mercenaria mercenaria]XP_053401195.1 BTB/POZ domain-containing protein 6-B-like [Mercenaria mercenaria]XP_053401196.1 BTB/POZ domain-containing protein 6-B-like [Mercenaria mercenaria]XP_053401197.1 BTB/POZ domain-containing protein 6-B-like [Mercenaria mercenaria]